MKLSGWGRFPVRETALTAPRSQGALQQALQQRKAIARGNGRAYGDSAIGQAQTIHMRHFNRMVSFDETSGVLVAEAGVLAGDIIASFLRRGWFLPVTPGTKFVTLGGMIAADVHGKNHHKDGSFGRFIDWIEVMEPDGSVTRCSADSNLNLFEWTVGGMGLTGMILRASIRLRAVESAWIRQETIPTPDLGATIDTLEASAGATYSVAWIDCLSRGAAQGRSLVMLGEHAGLEDLPDPHRRRPFEIPLKRRFSVPASPPGFLMNGFTMRMFNSLYYGKGQRSAGARFVDWDSYFYPLDAILNWNRIYGRRGFVQFQCVLPLETSRAGLKALTDAIADAGAGAFLSVLKRMGPQDSCFSFPMEGYTLALDFPANKRTLHLMETLDAITLAHQGRFYLAKDARMTADTLRRSDPRVDAFRQMRDNTDPCITFASAQSERLNL